MAITHADVREIEAIFWGLLHNAAARRQAAALVEPDSPSVDFRTGFAAGREAGELAGLALALSALTGESATTLIDEAVVQAAVDAVLPVEFHFLDPSDAPSGPADPREVG